MEGLWVVLLALLTAGYFALAGFDYGVGLLFRFVGRDEAERGRVLRSMTPFFLGNEVWLVAAAGVLFGAFPGLEGELLSAQRVPFVVVLVGLVAFTAAVQLRSHPWWDVPLVGGALTVAVGWGLLLGSVLGGPRALWGIGVPVLFLLHGAVFLTWRLRGPARERATRIARALVLPAVAFVAAAVAFGGVVREPGYGWIGAAVAVALLVGTWFALRSGAHRLAFLCTATTCVLPVLTVFGAQSVVTAGVMAHAPTLRALSWVALAVLPLVLLFQWATWWMSRAAR
ncbi:cytochrome d ubiquinol oxidase subunit II [Saccharothrix obliqua]|uniref:cytochrome d ubiquinol oxidase subunit II n=1 Tax=Saccharothrix obliqua TaxID=2861747 RepID=UPI001C5F19FD|nr:cytochrome d ubiquinol oxidase subunit II [Saccharothrix obliqua]MBW4719263.1 cytochrome d ubiquinol oxidase subunit II [Saccharothrix obliqua]